MWKRESDEPNLVAVVACFAERGWELRVARFVFPIGEKTGG